MKKTLLGATLALLLSACTEQAAIQVAALQGTVYEVGGQSLDLAGVEVTLVETGELALTDAQGGFDFERLAPGTYTLEFGPRFSSLAHHEGAFANAEGGEGEAGRDEGREGEREREGEGPSDREIEVEIKENGGDVEIRVAIEDDGRIKDIKMGDDEARDAMSHLRMPEDSDVRVEGSIKLKSTDEGERFKVAVYGLDAGATIDLCIGDTRIGSATADEKGVACFVRESGNLPLGKESLEGLFGLRLEIKLEGRTILFGEIPDLPEDDKRDGEDDKRDGDDDKRDGDDDKRDGDDDKRDGDDDKRDGEDDKRDGEDDKRGGEDDKRDGEDDKRDGEGEGDR